MDTMWRLVGGGGSKKDKQKKLLAKNAGPSCVAERMNDNEVDKSRLVSESGRIRFVSASARRSRQEMEEEENPTDVPRPKLRLSRNDLPAGSFPDLAQGSGSYRPTVGGKGPVLKPPNTGSSQFREEEEDEDEDRTEDDDSDDPNVNVEGEEVEEDEDEDEEEEEEVPLTTGRRLQGRGRGRGRSTVTSTSSGADVTSRHRRRDDSWKLTTSLDGGPLKPEILVGFLGHVAFQIWRGQERGPLKSPNRMKLLNKWTYMEIPEAARELIQQSGLGWLVGTTHAFIDLNLISAFVERWHPETNSFHMPWGEMTITLHDVAFLLKIPINGQAIHFSGEVLPIAAAFLNKTPAQLQNSSTEWRNGGLKFSTIKDLCSQGNVDASKIATDFLLRLLGATLFADKTENTVNSQFLPLLLDLDQVKSKSWGSAALAYMYRQLGIASRADCKEIAGYLTLLQAWIYSYFPRLAPPRRPDFDETAPLACKWATYEIPRSQGRLVQYRRQLDACVESEVNWRPFGLFPSKSFPLSLYSGIIYCRDVKEPYMPERVLRQFGFVQNIPPNPVAVPCQHLGPKSLKYLRKFMEEPGQFQRAILSIINPLSWTHETRADLLSTVGEYIPWFREISHPTVHNGEGAIEQQGESREQLFLTTASVHPQMYDGEWSTHDLRDTVGHLCNIWEAHMPAFRVNRNNEDNDLEM